MQFKREIPIKYSVDVFVAGGGTSGVAAAIAAAQSGASVYLAESQCVLGGTGTAGFIPSYMQLTDKVNNLIGGVGEQIINRLFEGEGEMVKRHRFIDTEKLKRVYDALLLENNVAFTFLSHVIGVEMNNGTIDYAVISAKSGIYAVKAKCYIDCTGDGDMAFLAGAEFQMGDENGNMMAGTLCSKLVNIDYSQVELFKDGKHLKEAYEKGIFSRKDDSLPGITYSKYNMAGGNIGHEFGVDGTDEVSVTKAMVDARNRILEYEQYYREFVPGCSDAHILMTANMLGIRESRRIIGDYILDLNDYINRSSFDDEIGRYCYPVDIHPSSPDDPNIKKNDEFYEKGRYKEGESYGIPYRILTPKGLDNLLVAGRSVSCDRAMLGSIRVMPGCYITGQAVGVAAAIVANENTTTRGFEISKLQKKLIDLGAYLPNSVWK